MKVFVAALLPLIFSPVLCNIAVPVRTTTSASEVDDNCGLEGYEAHCVLDIMEEHIEANAIINHCHIPLDITFRVIYRYGNGTEQRWQYTFVTTNQNERVLIPGLVLPPAPYALVYLFVRVPQPLFDMHNMSLAAVEASFVAVLSNDNWEEVEFLNEAFIVTTTDDCYPRKPNEPLFYILGGALFALLIVGSIIIGIVWCYRRRKLAMDELGLVSSMEIGLPGAQPYQIGQETENRRNNNLQKEVERVNSEKPQDSDNKSNDSNDQQLGPSKSNSGFKFGRLEEEAVDKEKWNAVKKMTDQAVVIANPELTDKAYRPKFNSISSNASNHTSSKMESVGDTFQNNHSIDMISNETQTKGSCEASITKDQLHSNSPKHPSENCDKVKGINPESKQRDAHPLELSEKENSARFVNGARPKSKPKKTGHQNEENSED